TLSFRSFRTILSRVFFLVQIVRLSELCGMSTFGTKRTFRGLFPRLSSNVCFLHITDIPQRSSNVPFWGESGHEAGSGKPRDHDPRHRGIAALRAHSWRCSLVELSMRACAPLRPIFLKKRTVKTMLGAART